MYCVRCGFSLPVYLIAEPPAKTARFFPAVKVDDRDPEGAFLRASCYKRDQIIETEDGSVVVPGRHVRFSMWADNSARCVLSLSESEARELATFIFEEFDSVPAD